jgi:uncharacterized membrane protein YheB (UPF0754 family)
VAPSLWTWLAVPAIAGLIGCVTNWIAVKMIFRPIRPRRLLGLKVQGLVGRRQRDLARNIGRVVGSHLVEHQDVVQSFERLDFAGILGSVLDRGLSPRVEELRSLPLIGGFLTAERVRDIRDSLVRGIVTHKDALLEELEKGLEQGLDVPRLVEEKVAEFPVERIEQIVLEVASRELRAIVLLGGLLGVVIGVGQVFVLWALA